MDLRGGCFGLLVLGGGTVCCGLLVWAGGPIWRAIAAQREQATLPAGAHPRAGGLSGGCAAALLCLLLIVYVVMVAGFLRFGGLLHMIGH